MPVSAASRENKMGTMPVSKLLINISLPIMISMLVQALYNIVDSLFVAQVSENALTAVSLAFPVQNLMIAISVGTGVGLNAMLSRALGEKNEEQVNAAALNGGFLYMMSYVLFIVLGLFFSRLYFSMQTDIPEIVEDGTIYTMICTVASFGLFGQIYCEKLLQATGRTMYSMIIQTVGAVINIILDPILIFGLMGVPKMGIAGAALATVFGQTCGMSLGIFLCKKKNPEVHLHFKGFRPSGEVIKRIYSVGVPSILMNSISSVMTFGMNQILMVFSSTATAVFGIYYKLQSFVFMPVFGLNNGMVSIISYNFGARKKKRIQETIRLGVIYATAIMFIGFLLFQIFPSQLLLMFNASESMMAIGVPSLRIISISFVLAGFGIVSSTVFQALGCAIYSLVISLIRQLAGILPLAWLLGRLGGLSAVWWGFPLADLSAVILSIFYLRRVLREKLSFVEEE